MDMKTIITLLLTLTIAVPAFAQTSAGDKPLAKEKWIRVNIQASVENINAEKREVTLKGPQGNLVTLTATEAGRAPNEVDPAGECRESNHIADLVHTLINEGIDRHVGLEGQTIKIMNSIFYFSLLIFSLIGSCCSASLDLSVRITTGAESCWILIR